MSPPARRALALTLALAFVVLGILLARREAGTAPVTPPATKLPARPGEAGPLAPAATGISAVGPDSAVTLPPSPTAPAPGGRPASSPTVSAEFQQVIAENSVPGRMVFLDFILDRTGLRLVGATGAGGRAKPAGTRAGFGFVHYEVFGLGGDLLLSGSVEDPTRRRLEHPAEGHDGRIAHTVQLSDEGPLSVRLPGELSAARIVFFRDRNPLVPGTHSREPIGDFTLRPSP